MKVSVVIPVFNAASFVTRAVSSALLQPETFEVILIEDGSTDNSLTICADIAKNDERVKLLVHPGNKNFGAAASRNYGMRTAQGDYIALLDADDYFLPNRFSLSKRLFKDNLDCDGVYEAIGIEFQSKESEEIWTASPMGKIRTTTMTTIVMPDQLLKTLLKGKNGRFHINGLVFKKSLLEKSGLMNEKLRSMNEDTDFILRLVIAGHLYSGSLTDPVAIRYVHTENRISAPRSDKQIAHDRLKMHMETYRWCKRKKHSEAQELLVNRMISDCLQSQTNPRQIPHNNHSVKVRKFRNLFFWIVDYPEIICEKTLLRELVISFFGILDIRKCSLV